MRESMFVRSARVLAVASTAVALFATALAVAATSTALGQDTGNCEVIDLGTLGSSAGSVLEAEGRWTTEDCDSRFRPGSDAHTYRFEIAEAGRVRVGLTSAQADSYLYLLAEDGRRITDDDDSGERLDARVERDLAPGAYLVEATTVGGRGRGQADFTLTVSRVDGCDFVDLGTLEPGVDLTASGSWSLETCGSRFVSSHPAHAYSFDLPEAGRVRIDLESENGDPVLSLASLQSGVIGANDDGGERRNARIEQYLQPGLYFIEATTYLSRDLQPLQADFTLTVRLVDEVANQQAARLKIEEVWTPSEVVAGDPFPVHYRIGNLGSGDLPRDGSHALIYLVGHRVFDLLDPVSGIWDAGVAYHTGDGAASASSTTNNRVTPFEATFHQHGPAWIFVGVVTNDPYGDEIGFHGQWHNLMVLSGPTFEPVEVGVDGSRYTVAAEADDEGLVTTSVHSVSDPGETVDPQVRHRAIYAAGVLTRLLDGVFERPAIAPLPAEAVPAPIDLADPSSSTLLQTFLHRYLAEAGTSELAEALATREALNPITIEDWVLDAADEVASHYAAIAASWSDLERRIERGAVLSFAEALTLQSQIHYAESVAAPVIAAGEIVEAARAADKGWEDREVRAMMADQAGCRLHKDALQDVLESAGTYGIEGLLALDAEMRSIRPVHGLAVDGVLCAAAATDGTNFRFLQRLGVGHSRDLREQLGLVAPAAEPPTPEPHRLRIIARVVDHGDLEFGVEFIGGEQILPPEHLLSRYGVTGSWQMTGDVEVDDTAIGRIRGRRLDGGRFEMGFVGADGEAITPDIAYLPADAPTGVWFRSSEIEVPAVVMDDRG